MRSQRENDDEKMFKFSVISPLIFSSEINIKKEIKTLSEKIYYFRGKDRKYSESTIKKWYYKYKNEGLDKLSRKTRKDRENSRKLTDDIEDYIAFYLEKYPKITTKNIYNKLVDENYIKEEEISIYSVYRYIKTNDMLRKKVIKEERRRYEKEHPNDVWQADTSYGPYIIIDDKKYRTYLIHFIDDNSRLVVGHGFFLSDSAINVQKVFKSAISTYGLPKQLYLDNGKSYSNDQLKLICARLPVKLTHTHAYDPESKGKVERCFKTIKEGWMYGKDWNQFKNLEDLNKEYDKYLYENYNNKMHSELGDTPNNIWHNGVKDIEIKYKDLEKLEEDFMHQIERKVSKDRTISLNNQLYEAPSIYKLQTVKLRYYISNPEKIWIYDDNGEKKEEIKKLDKVANSKIKRKISYAGIINDESEVMDYEEEEIDYAEIEENKDE